MKILLAPMQGVLDAPMRSIYTSVGGYDRCVTEFLRISQGVLPRRTFKLHAPELLQSGKTPYGIPVYFQLLGSHPELMALNAQRAVELGAPGIDLNFGCPSKTVNKSGGGSILLREPHRVESIIRSVRESIPASTPLTAKIRLGYEDSSLALENALAAQAGGACELTVHARTKKQGYKPPAHWEYLALIREQLEIDMIANGEVWNLQDYLRCRDISGIEHIMLGRGAIANPFLAMQIRHQNEGLLNRQEQWERIFELIQQYFHEMQIRKYRKARITRIKQWLVSLRHRYPQADSLFERLKKMNDEMEIENLFKSLSEQAA